MRKEDNSLLGIQQFKISKIKEKNQQFILIKVFNSQIKISKKKKNQQFILVKVFNSQFK